MPQSWAIESSGRFVDHAELPPQVCRVIFVPKSTDRFKALKTKDGLRALRYCSGVLVKKNTLLTAAHCFTTRMRETSYAKVTCGGQTADAILESVIISKKLAAFGEVFLSDLATVKLRATFSPVLTIAAPAQIRAFLKKGHCAIFGYGGSQVDELRGAWVDFLAEGYNSPISATFNNYVLPNQTSVWVGAESTALSGDSGGPLLCQDHQQWLVAGITGAYTPDNLGLHFNFFNRDGTWVIESIRPGVPNALATLESLLYEPWVVGL